MKLMHKSYKNIAAVAIPVYKEELNEMEKISFEQCLKIFKNHPIVLFAPENLNLSGYPINNNVSVERFNNSYFKDIKGYNSLMLSPVFYRRFLKFQYILIYQLDAFVFKDELHFWCNKGYDYIGAPWFKDFKEREKENALWLVGNGGFSLRKVKSFSKTLNYKIVKSPFGIISDYSGLNLLTQIIKAPNMIFKMLGYKNNYKYFAQQWAGNEDVFWGHYARHFKVPKVDVALKFSFEKSPKYLFEMNNNELPFGCHAWDKCDPKFWKEHIGKPEHTVS